MISIHETLRRKIEKTSFTFSLNISILEHLKHRWILAGEPDFSPFSRLFFANLAILPLERICAFRALQHQY